MTDAAVPNLPSRDFDRTERFYAALGFGRVWRDDGWMILSRGAIALEFFPHPTLEAASSWFSCCLRLDDLDAFYSVCVAAGVKEATAECPRLHAPGQAAWGGRAGALIDPDGTLLRLIQNPG